MKRRTYKIGKTIALQNYYMDKNGNIKTHTKEKLEIVGINKYTLQVKELNLFRTIKTISKPELFTYC